LPEQGKHAVDYRLSSFQVKLNIGSNRKAEATDCTTETSRPPSHRVIYEAQSDPCALLQFTGTQSNYHFASLA
jgi:hypothetical protein